MNQIKNYVVILLCQINWRFWKEKPLICLIQLNDWIISALHYWIVTKYSLNNDKMNSSYHNTTKYDVCKYKSFNENIILEFDTFFFWVEIKKDKGPKFKSIYNSHAYLLVVWCETRYVSWYIDLF